MIVSYEWATKRALEMSELISYSCFRKGAYGHLAEFLDDISGDDELALGFISGRVQTSWVWHRKNESAILFDVGASMILRNLLNKFGEGYNCKVIADIVKEAATQYLVTVDMKHSLYFRTVRFAQQGTFLTDREKALEHETVLQRFRPYFLRPSWLNIVEYFTIGHEYFHYLHKRKKLDFDLESFAGATLDMSIQNSGEEDSPARKQYHRANRESLLEEVACDRFSFDLVIDYLCKHTDTFSIKDLMSVGFALFIAHSFLDYLHTATRFGAQAVKSGSKNAFTQIAADQTIRKYGLITSVWDRIAEELKVIGDVALYHQCHAVFTSELRDLRQAMDTLYMSEINFRIELAYRLTEDAMVKNLPPEPREIFPELLYDFQIQQQIIEPGFIAERTPFIHDPNGKFVL